MKILKKILNIHTNHEAMKKHLRLPKNEIGKGVNERDVTMEIIKNVLIGYLL